MEVCAFGQHSHGLDLPVMAGPVERLAKCDLDDPVQM